MDFLVDEKSYANYLEEKLVSNDKVREDNETFFDALMSDDADIKAIPNGTEVLETLQQLARKG